MIYIGEVVHGQKLGRQIGFPTANLEPTSNFFSLGNGVYAVEVSYHTVKYLGVMNIGMRPTIDKDSCYLSVEVHILDFDKKIYGEKLEINPVTFIRKEKGFNSIEELKNQILKDTQVTREIFSKRKSSIGIRS
jgi:riboflavin kinase/FMN adenylyltransferase